MADGSIYTTFRKDTKDFTHEINNSLIRLEKEGYSADLINHIFRCIHSIKSEAAYLELNEITSAAHDMESAIEPLRNVGQPVEVDPALIEFCFKTLDRIGTLVEQHEDLPDEEVCDGELEELELSDCDDDEPGFETEVEQPAETLTAEKGPYSDFELMLLRDSRSRGEHLYRTSFSVAEEEPMKYPRAYLALSNLEQELNVIKIDPSLDCFEEHPDGRISVVLSTNKDADEIMERLAVDQIVEIETTELSYENELKNDALPAEEPAELTIVPHERIVSVEADDIDAISEYVSEIKNRLLDLSSSFKSDGGGDRLEYDLAGLESISGSIEKMMSNLQTVDFNNHFAGYRRTVRDLARKLDKKAELSFGAQKRRIPRDFADFIAEPLLQLIRNAVVHGIEAPQQRLDAGKPETGVIRLELDLNDVSVTVTVSDDGSGIDTRNNPDKFGNIETDGQLLELLVQPGFTTRNVSEDYAGRGVGLDLVSSKIQKRNGLLRLENSPGESFSLSLVFPAESLG